MLILGIARPRTRTGRVLDFEGEQLLLEPWAVQAALQPPPWRRSGSPTRSVAEIERCTRDPEIAALATKDRRMTERRRRGSRRIGYRRPPASTRFRKGQSGNPRGRPRGRRNEPPYEAVLGQMVTIREDGVERRVTAAEAFLLHVTKRGLEGDGAAARAAMAAIEEARAARLASEPDESIHLHDDL